MVPVYSGIDVDGAAAQRGKHDGGIAEPRLDRHARFTRLPRGARNDLGEYVRFGKALGADDELGRIAMRAERPRPASNASAHRTPRPRERGVIRA
jgi:hypothetical protein